MQLNSLDTASAVCIRIVSSHHVSSSLCAGAERNHWLRFDENMATRHEWATQLLNSFRDDVTKIRSLFTNSAPTSPTSETAPSSGGASSQSNSKHTGNHVRQSQSANFGGGGGGVTSADQGHSAAFQAAKNTKLLENSIIVRLEDLVVHQVGHVTMSSSGTMIL